MRYCVIFYDGVDNRVAIVTDWSGNAMPFGGAVDRALENRFGSRVSVTAIVPIDNPNRPWDEVVYNSEGDELERTYLDL